MLAWLLTATPVGTATPTFAGERHCIASPQLRARRHGEAARLHWPDLCSLVAQERETSMYTTGYTQLDHGSPPVVRAPGCFRHRWGVSTSAPLPGGATWGRKERRQEGSARVGTPKITGYGGCTDSRVFGVPWRSRVPVLDLCPFARLPDSLLEVHSESRKSRASAFGHRST